MVTDVVVDFVHGGGRNGGGGGGGGGHDGLCSHNVFDEY